jgi:hypothetical protein
VRRVTGAAEAAQVIVHVTTKEESGHWKGLLNEENHFLVWTKHDMGVARELNRMIRYKGATRARKRRVGNVAAWKRHKIIRTLL